MGERSFSKSWGLRASGSFVPLPLPRHSFFFCSCPSFLDEPREETLATQARGGLPIYLEEDLQRVQNRRLNVIGLPRDTVESLVIRRQNLTRKEFKRMLESEAHPCKRFLEKPVDHGHNLRSCKTNPAHLRIPVSRTVRHKQSFISRGAKLNLI